MAKFADVIGFATQEEIKPGVWDKVIVERKFYGEVLKNIRKLVEGEPINEATTFGNSISIVANAYALANHSAMQYIKWAGTYWTISNIDKDPDRPRLLLRLGGVYNGPRATSGGDETP